MRIFENRTVQANMAIIKNGKTQNKMTLIENKKDTEQDGVNRK